MRSGYFSIKPIGYVQLALFIIVCAAGYYIDVVGLGGGTAAPDRVHVHLVKFSGNASRYLTDQQMFLFGATWILIIGCILIFLLLLISQIIWKLRGKLVRG